MTRQAVALLLVVAAYWATALFPVGALRGPDVPLTVACGLVLGLTIVLVAARLDVSRGRQFVVWFALIFLNLASVAVEGTLFAPAASPSSLLVANVFRLAVGAAVMAGAVAVVFGTPAHSPARPTHGWWWRLIVAAGVYFVLYLVLGGINYSLVTHPYYETHAGSLTVPPATTIFLYEPIRGLLIALSLLPLVAVMQGRNAFVALVAGSLVFVAGGLAPLLPETSLPLYLRVASLWEIFGQNFLTGVAVVYLFKVSRPAKSIEGWGRPSSLWRPRPVVQHERLEPRR